MRALSLTGMPPPNASTDAKLAWCMQALTTIAAFSRQEGSTLADAYTIKAPTPPLRKLDVTNNTPTQTAEVLATFLRDMQKRGVQGGDGVTAEDEGGGGPPGPPGPTGPSGPAGSSGPAGPTGPAGAAGPTGSSGPAGASGASGPPGPILFFDPAEPDEPAMVPGQPGTPGLPGSPGSPGAPGPQGATAYLEGPEADEPIVIPGAPGQSGAPGLTGAPGPIGPPVYLEAPEADEPLPGPPGSPGLQGRAIHGGWIPIPSSMSSGNGSGFSGGACCIPPTTGHS